MSNEKTTIEFFNSQFDFLACGDRFTAFVGGVGSGKTFAGSAKALAECKAGRLGLVVAQTYPMLRDATLRTFLEIADGAVRDFYKTEMRLEMRNGAEILFRSADKPDRLRGPNLHWAWLDEAALCPSQTWEIVIGRLRAGGTAGPCFVTTTPKGRNWLYERQGQLTMFRASTEQNPYLDTEFIESLKASYTGAFAKQELYGEFVTFEGLVYEEFNRDVHVCEHEGAFARYIGCMDEGYTNPSVVLVLGIDNDGRAHIVEEFYRRRVLQGDVVAEAKRLWKAYGIDTFYVDPSAAGLIAEMRSESLVVMPADHAVMPGIQDVKARLVVQADGSPRLTVAPSCVNTMAEFESYAWKQSRQGVRDEPEKLNDHAMDALRYGVRSLVHSGPNITFV